MQKCYQQQADSADWCRQQLKIMSANFSRLLLRKIQTANKKCFILGFIHHETFKKVIIMGVIVIFVQNDMKMASIEVEIWHGEKSKQSGQIFYYL